MPEIQYKTLVWLTYRLIATFSFGLPIVLFVWSSIKKETSILRLLSIYWKVSSLIAISILLLTSNQPIGYITSFISPLFIIFSLWFWVDLNEEIQEMPPWRALTLTTKVWRLSLTLLGTIYAWLTYKSLSCFNSVTSNNCIAWVEDPQNLHKLN